MSLNDLVPHIPHQESKIDQLATSLDRFFSHGSLLVGWVTFRDSLWGQKLQSEQVVQEDGTVYTIVTFPKTIPKVLSRGTSRILVRAEYEETERAEATSARFWSPDNPGSVGPLAFRHLQNLIFHQGKPSF